MDGSGAPGLRSRRTSMLEPSGPVIGRSGG